MKYNKYNASKTVVDGIRFDSRAEARRYRELKLLQQAGEIKDLELQPSFLLIERFKCRGKNYRDTRYIADFAYIEVKTGLQVVEDVKGVETEVFRLKKKLFLKRYGNLYDFRVVRM